MSRRGLKLDDDLLDRLAAHREGLIRQHVAMLDGLPERIARRLADDDEGWVRAEIVARYPEVVCWDDVRDDGHPAVRDAVLGCVSAPTDVVVATISYDLDRFEDVRDIGGDLIVWKRCYLAANHPNTPDSVIVRLPARAVWDRHPARLGGSSSERHVVDKICADGFAGSVGELRELAALVVA